MSALEKKQPIAIQIMAAAILDLQREARMLRDNRQELGERLQNIDKQLATAEANIQSLQDMKSKIEREAHAAEIVAQINKMVPTP